MTDNKFRKREVMARCVPMNTLQAVLSGKWKFLILWYIAFYKVQRFGELLRRMDGITQSTLTKQLRELEDDGFIHREIYKEIPPESRIYFDETRKKFCSRFNAMMIWSQTHLCAPDYVCPYSEEEIKELLNS